MCAIRLMHDTLDKVIETVRAYFHHCYKTTKDTADHILCGSNSSVDKAPGFHIEWVGF